VAEAAVDAAFLDRCSVWLAKARYSNGQRTAAGHGSICAVGGSCCWMVVLRLDAVGAASCVVSVVALYAALVLCGWHDSWVMRLCHCSGPLPMSCLVVP